MAQELVRCKRCNCYVDLELGAIEPALTSMNDGSKEYPKAPGDWDDECADCYYGKDIHG